MFPVLARLILAASAATLFVADAQRDVLFELAKRCTEQLGTFGMALDATQTSDATVDVRFRDACSELFRQDGLDFGPNLNVYTCRVFLPRSAQLLGPEWAKRNEELLDKVERAFRRRITPEAFQGHSRDDEPIGSQAHLDGMDATFVILADTTGTVVNVLYTLGDLNRTIREVRSLAGAMDLLELQNKLGAAWERPKPQCSARELVEDAGGWTIRQVFNRENCTAPHADDFRIERSGSVKTVGSARLAGGAVCE